MRRLKTKAARDHEDGVSSPTARSDLGVTSSFAEPPPGLGNFAGGPTSFEKLCARISSCVPARIPQMLAELEANGISAADSVTVREYLIERFWHCLQHGFASVGATIVVATRSWQTSLSLACIDAVDARSPERPKIVEIFLSCPDFPPNLRSGLLDRLSPECAIKLIRKNNFDLRTFPSHFQHAVFKELAWICSQFEFNQVFGTLLISAIACYPDVPVLAFVKHRLPHFFDAAKKSFLENPRAQLLPSLPPPEPTPSGYSVPSHVNMRLVSDATGLLECIDMVRGNLTIGIDMEWSGTGVLSHPSGQAPADLIQIGNSPSAMHCSVFLLDTRAIQQQVNLVEILVRELFSPEHTVLVCDFSADKLALAAAFPQAKFPDMVAPPLLDLSVTCGKTKKSLSNLAKDICQVNLSKSWQICGWNLRPLLPSQLEYATSDVLVMHLVHEQQQMASQLKSGR